MSNNLFRRMINSTSDGDEKRGVVTRSMVRSNIPKIKLKFCVKIGGKKLMYICFF